MKDCNRKKIIIDNAFVYAVTLEIVIDNEDPKPEIIGAKYMVPNRKG